MAKTTSQRLPLLGFGPCSVLAQFIILIMEERTDVSNSGGPSLSAPSTLTGICDWRVREIAD